MTESELALAEQKTNDYNVLLNKLKQEYSHQVSSHQVEMKKEKEVCFFSQPELCLSIYQ